MRRLAPFLVAGLACGCGGGGAGSGAPAPAAVDAPAPVPARSLEQVLDDCATQDVRDAVDFLRTVAAATQDGAVEGFDVTGVDPLSLRVSWSLDADLDGAPEARGSLRFLDDAGRPTIPIDPRALASGAIDVVALLSSVPDGTRAIVTADVLRFVEGGGEVEVAFAAGMPRTASGSLAVADGPCATTLRFDDLLLPTAAGGFPTGVVAVEAVAGADDVEGTLTLDGTSTARLRGTVNGGPVEETTVDLATVR